MGDVANSEATLPDAKIIPLFGRRRESKGDTASDYLPAREADEDETVQPAQIQVLSFENLLTHFYVQGEADE